jgi:hypothetical protein
LFAKTRSRSFDNLFFSGMAVLIFVSVGSEATPVSRPASYSQSFMALFLGGNHMLRFAAVLLVLVFVALVPSSVLAQDKLVVFGGYSYLRPPVSVEEAFVCVGPVCPIATIPPATITNRQNLNGWALSATYRFLPFLGLTADLSGHYGSAASSFSSNAHQYTYLFGPEVSLPSRVSPFAHVLFGGTHQSISGVTLNIPIPIPTYNAILPASNSGFATAIGAGIDLKIIPHVWIRPIQIDYLITRLASNTQSQVRASAGVVLHF